MECVVHASNGDDIVTEDENSVDRTDVLLDKCYNTLLVDLLVLITTQPRCVENTNLEKWLRVEAAFKNIGTYQYTTVATNFIEVRYLYTTMGRRTLVENIKVVVINVISKKDIGDECQE